MKKSIAFLCAVLSLTGICKAQTSSASIFLSADTVVNVEAFAPLDGAYIGRSTDIFQVSPQQRVHYTVDIKDYCFTQINIGRWCFLLTFPGDSITLKLNNNGGVIIGGDNAAGHQYYNSKWDYTGEFCDELRRDVFDTDDYSDFRERFEKKFIEPTKADIDKMVLSGSISPEFAAALMRELVNGQRNEFFETMRNVHYNKKLTDQQKSQIQTIVDRMINEYSKLDDDLIWLRHRLGYSYLPWKYDMLYANLSDAEKKQLLGKYKPEDFGAQTMWLLAPKEVQINFIGREILAQQKYGSMGMEPINTVFLMNYLRKIAPESEMVKFLAATEELQNAKKIDLASIKYMDGPINSFAELMARPELKGNYCLIDLWATWCMPCLMEHKHAKELHKAVADFKNLKQVYITIDVPKDEKRWKATVEKFNLSGLHLMATPELQKEIQAKIFQGKDISVPQYFLLSPTGEILNPELPRPSELKELKQALSQSVGKVS